MPIKYIKGDIFASNCEVLVNPVNCVGIMGAGLAKQFKERYPTNYHQYKRACSAGKLKMGTIDIHNYSYEGDYYYDYEHYIINFPTKIHYNRPSKLEYIEHGLKVLRKYLVITESPTIPRRFKHQSIAIPKLGCGLGGLKWKEVKKLIEKYLGDLNILVECYI
jgi:O-acetyl-ADP-ribose deacetylase (regulator of RNase III)